MEDSRIEVASIATKKIVGRNRRFWQDLLILTIIGGRLLERVTSNRIRDGGTHAIVDFLLASIFCRAFEPFLGLLRSPYVGRMRQLWKLRCCKQRV